MVNKLVSINILTYNGQHLIGPCLKSVLKQTYPKIEILIIDNASKDATVEKIGKYKKQKTKFPLKIIENKKNIGFAAGHNVGIERARGEYVLCLNQDVILDKNFVNYAVKAIKKEKNISSIQGKIYKTKNILRPEKKIIDAVGLVIFKNRRIIAKGQGTKEKKQYNRKQEIFGTDGAAPLYRKKALEDIKINNEYFDKDFFCYKEDVDLAWRLKLRNWKAIYEPKAIAYHLRGAGESAAKTPKEIIEQRKKISQNTKLWSFKNQRLMQIKNELPGLFFRDIFYILIKEVGAWIYVLFFEKHTSSAIKKLFQQTPKAWKKRKIIMANKKASTKSMAKWFD